MLSILYTGSLFLTAFSILEDALGKIQQVFDVREMLGEGWTLLSITQTGGQYKRIWTIQHTLVLCLARLRKSICLSYLCQEFGNTKEASDCENLGWLCFRRTNILLNL